MKFVNAFPEYNGRIILQVGSDFRIHKAEVWYKNREYLKLGYIMGSKTVHSSTCLSDFDKGMNITNLNQEAFSIFNLSEISESELSLLGYNREE